MTVRPVAGAVRTETVPSCERTTAWTIAIPGPLPATPPPARKKRSNIRSASSALIPGPSSRTCNRTSPASERVSADGSYILSAPAGGSYLPAVVTREYEPWTRHVMVGREPLIQDLTLSPSEAASPSRPA